MKILAIEKEVAGVAAKDFQPHLRAEAARAWELYQSGVLRELYFCADWPGAVLMLECADLEAARAALDTLPLVQEHLLEFELIPLKPYPGFARLFGPPGV
jgi:hypothetical protein